MTPTSWMRGGYGPTRSIWMEITSSPTSSFTRCTAGLKRSMCPTMSDTPLALAAATSSAPSAEVAASGFSMSSDAPLAMTLSPTSWCRLVGTQTLTASRPRASSSSRLV